MTSSVELITIQELLRDPQYRVYFTKVPQLPDHIANNPTAMPWKLYVLKKDEDKWRTKKFHTYGEAFAGLKKMLPRIENGAINCPGLSFIPPIKNYRLKGKMENKKPAMRTKVWQPRIDADLARHNWCPHCRRPSVFNIATKPFISPSGHKIPLGEPMMRCMICGASERVVDLRNPLSHQRWDLNRPTIYTLLTK